jgi:RNA polymerase sigma factor (sigma-70 family)
VNGCRIRKRGDGVKIDFEDIYDRFFKDVYLFVLAMSGNQALAEDITQETFFKALKEIDNFKGNCSVKSWLCQIAKNLYIDGVRRGKRFESVKEDLAGVPSAEKDIESAVIKREEVISIYKVLHCLEEPYKEVFGLRTLGELSYREIGDIFEKSESWARVTYHRAKIKIREQMM